METTGTLSSVEFSAHYFHLPVRQLMQCYRCMEHSLHLGAGHVLSHIVPVPTRKTNDTRNEDEDDGLSSDDSSTDESGAITPGALHKMMGLIKQVR